MRCLMLIGYLMTFIHWSFEWHSVGWMSRANLIWWCPTWQSNLRSQIAMSPWKYANSAFIAEKQYRRCDRSKSCSLIYYKGWVLEESLWGEGTSVSEYGAICQQMDLGQMCVIATIHHSKLLGLANGNSSKAHMHTRFRLLGDIIQKMTHERIHGFQHISAEWGRLFMECMKVMAPSCYNAAFRVCEPHHCAMVIKPSVCPLMGITEEEQCPHQTCTLHHQLSKCQDKAAKAPFD